MEDSKEEDPVWLLSENSNLVGGKIVALFGKEGEWRSKACRRVHLTLNKEAARTLGGQFAESRPTLCSRGSPEAFFSRCLAKPQLEVDSFCP